MNKSSSAIIGTSGAYFVMAQLAARNFHASCTFGNAPYIDILLSSQDARRTASLQVKTARWAQREKGRGSNRVLDHYEWYLGHKVASMPKDSNLFYAFVDLKQVYWERGYKPTDINPDIFIIPLAVIAEWYKNNVNPKSMSRFHGSLAFVNRYKDAYHLLEKAIAD